MGNRVFVVSFVILALFAFSGVRAPAGEGDSPAIAGKVVGKDGKPVAGAIVKWIAAPRRRPGAPPVPPLVPWARLDEQRGVVAGKDGAWSATVPRGGEYTVAASAPGHQSLARRITVDEGRGRDGIELHLLPGEVVAGRVVDGKGEPIAGASVSVSREAAGERARPEGPRDGFGVLTGEDGGFRVDTLPPGKYQVLARAPGKANACRSHVEPGTEDLEVVLPDGEPIGGIVHYPDGTPAAFVAYTIEDDTRTVYGYATDANGRFRTPPIAPGEYRVVLHPRTRHPWGSPDAQAAKCRDTTVAGVKSGTLDLVIDLVLDPNR